jgi:hypothetical protein
MKRTAYTKEKKERKKIYMKKMGVGGCQGDVVGSLEKRQEKKIRKRKEKVAWEKMKLSKSRIRIPW